VIRARLGHTDAARRWRLRARPAEVPINEPDRVFVACYARHELTGAAQASRSVCSHLIASGSAAVLALPSLAPGLHELLGKPRMRPLGCAYLVVRSSATSTISVAGLTIGSPQIILLGIVPYTAFSPSASQGAGCHGSDRAVVGEPRIPTLSRPPSRSLPLDRSLPRDRARALKMSLSRSAPLIPWLMNLGLLASVTVNSLDASAATDRRSIHRHDNCLAWNDVARSQHVEVVLLGPCRRLDSRGGGSTSNCRSGQLRPVSRDCCTRWASSRRSRRRR
jgi:hypothetical protein